MDEKTGALIKRFLPVDAGADVSLTARYGGLGGPLRRFNPEERWSFRV